MQIKREKTNRKVSREINAARAGDAIGTLWTGCEIYGLSKGQFSLVEIIEHCLNQTGPAHVTISTWTAAGADLTHTNNLLHSGSVLSAKWLVDTSFPSRQPGYCKILEELFGTESIVVTKNHCKFVLLRNENWNLVIRTSMNLNLNNRLENFEISDDKQMAEMLETLYQGIKAEGLTLAARKKKGVSFSNKGLNSVLGPLEAIPQEVAYNAEAGISSHGSSRVSYD